MNRIVRTCPAVLILASMFAALPREADADDAVGEWAGRLFGFPGLHGSAYAQAVFDEGTGPALYVGGSAQVAGIVNVGNVARWDGRRWSRVGEAPDDQVLALCVFEGELYAGGRFLNAGGGAAGHVARWDGTSWKPVGSGVDGDVEAMVVFDDGSGPALYVGGAFQLAGGASASHVARWDGSSWSAVGGGLSGRVSALLPYDDGTGEALFAGGEFVGPEGAYISQLRFGVWSDVGGGMDGAVRAFTVFDEGNGDRLFAGGEFRRAGGRDVYNVGRWNGLQWSKVGPGLISNATRRVYALAAHDDGSGPKLYAGGSIFEVENRDVAHVIRWDGSDWRGVGIGTTSSARSLLSFDLGSGPILSAGILFSIGGKYTFGIHTGLMHWDGSEWCTVGTGGVDNDVMVLKAADIGDGEALYVGGALEFAGDVIATGIARYDGAWTSLDAGLSQHDLVTAMEVFDDGTGPALYVGGDFFDIADGLPGPITRWNGTDWQSVGLQAFGDLQDLLVVGLSTGPVLVASESVSVAQGRLQAWDGVSWSILAQFDGPVRTMAVYDDGAGPTLFVGGDFTGRLARYNGVDFDVVGGGLSGGPEVFDLEIFDDGHGEKLYVGGSFTMAAGQPKPYLVTWDGVAFGEVGGGGFDHRVHALLVHDDESGSALYVGGSFTDIAGLDAERVARWNGTSWQRLGSGLESRSGRAASVFAFESYDDGTGSALYVGGTFTVAGGDVSANLARFAATPAVCRAGNVGTSGGAGAIDVLSVNGSAGDALFRGVDVTAGQPASIGIERPPGGGNGHYALWICDGAPHAAEASLIGYQNAGGEIFVLGTGCFGFPSNNLVLPGTVPCPGTFRIGRTSKSLGRAVAARACLNPAPGFPRAPTSFPLVFPAGVFTVCGLIVDPDSPNAQPISIANTVVVESR